MKRMDFTTKYKYPIKAINPVIITKWFTYCVLQHNTQVVNIDD